MKKKTSRSGAALVITLSLVILLTIVILAFMSIVRWDRQSAGLTAATKRAELLGRSAGNLVLSDLISEIRDGSTNLGSAAAIAYSATANDNMLPQRVLAGANLAANTNFVALYKQSVQSPFYSGANFVSNGPSRASSVGTWEASRNGRVLSADRWNKPQLLFGGGFSSTNDLPRWIYLTRQETTDAGQLNPTNFSPGLISSTNQNFVIARTAYNVYEIGQCLDINVAGGLSGLTKQQLLSSLAGATLASVPGVTDTSALLAWRNATSGASTTTYMAYAGTNGLKEGFLNKTTGDRRFIGRQDLIAYATQNASGGFGINTLPFLTHFSRGLDRPSVRATANTSVLSGYPNRPATGNAAPTAVRHATDVILADGTRLNAGDPVAFRRFPLRRLDLLRSADAVAPDDANPIYRYFGLSRAGVAQPWVYNHGAANRILTLKEVAALPQKREPDFFEMLQAAIAPGSLGGSAGPYFSGNAQYATDTEGLDENIYRQILQIGANLIDQYDADDYPTTINIQDAASAILSVYGNENLPYINEIGSLPYRPATLPRTKVRGYLQFEVWNPHQNAVNTDATLKLRIAVTKGKIGLLFGVASYSNGSGPARFNELYNDAVATAYHYSATSAASFATDYPGIAFRIGSSGSAVGAFDFSNPQVQTDHGILEFTNSPQLKEPFLLTSPNDPATLESANFPPYAYPVDNSVTTSPDSIVEETTPDSLPLQDYPSLTSPTISSPNGLRLDLKTPIYFAGIMIAEAEKPDDRVDGRPDQMCWGTPAPGCWDTAIFNFSNPLTDSLTVELQVYTPQGWQTYQKLQNIRALSTSNRVGNASASPFPANQTASISFIRPNISARPNNSVANPVKLHIGYNTIFAIDPRTSRFTYILRDVNGPVSVQNSSQLATNFKIYGNGTDWDPGTASSSSKSFSALAANIPNHESGQQFYKDPDGIVRRADGEERPEIVANDRVFPMNGGSNLKAGTGYKVALGKMADRPLILNRPFNSVAEMGYAFRDMPWKTLDFHSTDTGDGGLLDYFSVEETALDGSDRPLRAGVINPNTASPAVLSAVISSAVQRELGAAAVDSARVQAIVNSVRNAVATTPLMSLAELPRLADSSTFPSASTKVLQKTEKETFVRALAPVSETNVWNVLIDIVTQAGRIPPDAKGLGDFVVQGEARYWIFAAIDRTTGQIVDMQYELVTE